MALKRRIELIENSTDRMRRMLNLEIEPYLLLFSLRMETWIHLKSTIGLFIAILRKEAKE